MLDGGGHRVHGRLNAPKPRGKSGRSGYTYLHSALDDYSCHRSCTPPSARTPEGGVNRDDRPELFRP